MAGYRGDFVAGAKVYISFNTRDASGNPITLAGSPTVAVYQQNNTSACTVAPTLTVNYNSQTGRHMVAIDTSVTTSPTGFYASGNDYFVVLTAGTVNGVSVVAVEVGSFSINNRTEAAVPTSIWQDLLSTTDFSTVGSVGALIKANLDTNIGSRLATTSYVSPTTPPTVVQIRQEMDTNSTKLANLDATVSSRLASSGYTVPPTVSAIQSGLATHTDATTIEAAITALGSPLQSTAYVAPTTPPTVVQIRQEMDTNSTKLAAAATAAGVSSAANAILAAVGSPLQTSSYVSPPSASTIAAAVAGVIFVDGSMNPLKVNTDHSVNTSGGQIVVSNVVPPAVAAASQNPQMIAFTTFNVFRYTLTLGAIGSRTGLWFCLKANPDDPDSAALILISEAGGLLVANGAAASNSALGSLTVTDPTAGTVNVYVNESITGLITPTNGPFDLYWWDSKVRVGTDTTAPQSGRAVVAPGITRAY